MDFGHEVANNLAVSCMKQFLEQNGNVPAVRNYNISFSEQELLNTPKNYCAVAVVDYTTRVANYLSYGMVPASIRTVQSACVAGVNSYAVFVSNFDNKRLKENILRLYKQYFQSLTGSTVLESISDMVSNVRKSDSEQLMLLALETQEVRDNLFHDMDIGNDIRLVVYSLRDSCQHCHLMLGGFLKEMLEAQKLRAIDFFFSFSAGTNYGTRGMEIRKHTSLCLISPLFRNIPFTKEESVRSLVLADCKSNTIGDSILVPRKVNNQIMANLIFQQTGIIFQNNISERIFVIRLNNLIPRMDLNTFQHIAKDILTQLWNTAVDSHFLPNENDSLLLNLLSRARELNANEILALLKKIHLTEIEQNLQLGNICRELGLLEE